MAEIQVERKPKSHAPLLLAVLLLAAVLGAGWYYMMGPGAGTLDRNEGADLLPPASVPAPVTRPPETAPTPGTGTPGTGTGTPGTGTPGPTTPAPQGP